MDPKAGVTQLLSFSLSFQQMLLVFISLFLSFSSWLSFLAHVHMVTWKTLGGFCSNYFSFNLTSVKILDKSAASLPDWNLLKLRIPSPFTVSFQSAAQELRIILWAREFTHKLRIKALQLPSRTKTIFVTNTPKKNKNKPLIFSLVNETLNGMGTK